MQKPGRQHQKLETIPVEDRYIVVFGLCHLFELGSCLNPFETLYF